MSADPQEPGCDPGEHQSSRPRGEGSQPNAPAPVAPAPVEPAPVAQDPAEEASAEDASGEGLGAAAKAGEPPLRGVDRLEWALQRSRWVAALGLVVLVLVLGYRVTLREGAEGKGDLRFYQRGAERFWSAQPLYYYDPLAGPDAPRPLAWRRTTSYTYLPPFAASMGWSVRLPYRWLRGLWILGSVLALGGGLWVTWRLRRSGTLAQRRGPGIASAALGGEGGGEPGPCSAQGTQRKQGTDRRTLAGAAAGSSGRGALWCALLALFLGRFVVNDLAHGQVNAFLAFLIALGIYEVYRERPLRGGVWIGVALVIKPTSWLLLPWLALDRRWRGLGSACATGLAALALAGLLYGGDYVGEIQEWFRLMPGFADAESARPYNASLASTLQRLFSGSLPSKALVPERLLFSADLAWARPLARGVACVTVVAGLTLAFWRRRAGRVSGARAAAAVLILSALLSPVTWKAHFVALLAPLAFVADDLAGAGAGERGPVRWRWALACGVLGLWLLPSRGLGALGSGLEAWGALTLGLCLVFALCLWPPRRVASR